MSFTVRDNTSYSDFSAVSLDIWISDETCHIFQYIVYVFACQSISVLGIGANIINIICFVEQGFQDSVNVNFVALALSDTGCLVTLVFIGIGYNPSFQTMDKPFDSIELMYLTVGWPHLAFVRLTSYITALITLERCLCITIPLKVKSVFNPQRVFLIILIICGIAICNVLPVYCVNWLALTFSPEKNRTILALEFIPTKDQYEYVSYAFNMVGSYVAFLINIICTVTLVIKLKNKSKWRMSSVVSKQAQDFGNREQKVAKMIVVISTLFIACYLPICLMFIAMMFLPEITLDGRNRNVVIVIAGIGLVLESVNSSTNLFVYYAMSSKYRKLVLKLLNEKKM